MLGAMLADVPHTRPISTFASSEDAEVRADLDLERSTYEGPVGILSRPLATPRRGWASRRSRSGRPCRTTCTTRRRRRRPWRCSSGSRACSTSHVPRGDLETEASAWESGIDALANEDEDMAAYIEQLEKARDTVDSPEASGEAIAREFERYLRRGEGPGEREALSLRRRAGLDP